MSIPASRPQSRLDHHAHGHWGLLGLVLVLLLVAGLPGQAWDSNTVEVRDAWFTDPLRGEPVQVALPDTWAARHQPGQRIGRYAMTFDLAEPPGGVWALRADRLPNHHEVRVNGTELHNTLDTAGQNLRRPLPTLLVLPAGLLRTGRNALEITVDVGERAGLSRLTIGPMTEVLPGFRSAQRWHDTLPQALNAASAGLALFMLLVWVWRRSEQVIGSFGAITLLASLRNLGYFSVDSPVPGTVSDVLFFSAQVLSAGLMGVFAMARTGWHPRWYRRLLVGAGLVLLLAGLVAALTGTLWLARRWAYPLLLGLCLPALGALVGQALHTPGRRPHLMLAGWGLVLAAAAHDYAAQTGLVSLTHDYALPLAVPLLVALFSATQWQRLLRGMAELEQLNTQLEARVAERTQALDAANEAKTRFLAAASHDLRQPVATMNLLLELLRERPLDPGLRALSQRLDTAGATMDRLLTGLLDLSRLDGGHVAVHRQSVALQPLLRSIVGQHDEQAQRQGLRLLLHPTSVVVDSDSALLAQVLQNLVGNAVRHTVRGGVLVGVRPHGAGFVRVVVQDTGPGIDPAHHARIFEEFVQLDPPSQATGTRGVGLGLTIARRSASLIGATLTLDSVPGRGSRFSLILPRAERVLSAPDATSACAAPAAPRPPPPGSGC